MAKSDHPDYVAAVEKAARGWKVTPFKRAGKPLRVCTLEEVAYPSDRRPPFDQLVVPPPPPPSAIGTGGVQNVPPNMLEGYRISGDKIIVPDDASSMIRATSPSGTLANELRSPRR